MTTRRTGSLVPLVLPLIILLALASTLVSAQPSAGADTTPSKVRVASSAEDPETAVLARLGLPLDAAARELVTEARDAFRRRDTKALAALRQKALAQRHPLGPWFDYWDLNLRLDKATNAEVEAFFARWPGSYVEDRLRNDWLLVLGKRRDWAQVRVQHPRFRMNDDREVTCYALLARHLTGEAVTEPARRAWLDQRDADDGCRLLAQTLHDADEFGAKDIWRKVWAAAEAGRGGAASAAAAMLGDKTARQVSLAFANPERLLKAARVLRPSEDRWVRALAVLRLARAEPAKAARQLTQPWARTLPEPLIALAWAGVARQAAMQQHAEAARWYRNAFERLQAGKSGTDEALGWSADTLAWAVRSALRAGEGHTPAWPLVLQATAAMEGEQRDDPAWIYWRARALQATATGRHTQTQTAEARRLLSSIASPLHFYGKLAAEDLGHDLRLPGAPVPATAAETQAARQHLGLTRGLALVKLGLRSEGVREWNFSLRGLDDRALLAAATRACEVEVWDRCINTSDRTRSEVDLAQRFPTPFRDDVVAAARAIGLDPATVYGLIRQESRFIMDARSSAGASGLMQLMPATARWTARKLGMAYSPSMITEREVNLRLGTAYLKLVLDDFQGSVALAAAAYNAGPNRPRRWREGVRLEAAAWAETIPFSETRDYVKKVLSNASIYGAMLEGASQPRLKTRLGGPIGPRDMTAPPTDRELP
ncbi:MAG: hypothetical protein RLZ83_2125 [Pseudomonadota bacterium]|jgi:soluble lytic murein transglycosylase